jgi:glycosyltransferase involved in cell wall biosynthesis
MACGVPVVVSDLPFNTEFISPKCGALVDGNCAKAIAQGLVKVLNKKNAELMRLEARRVAEEWSYEYRINRIEEIFRCAAKAQAEKNCGL